MGFIPIFLTLGGFIFLFIIVVSTSIKNKKRDFEASFENLKGSLHVTEDLRADRENLNYLENLYLQKKEEVRREAKAALSQAKLHLFQYNRLLGKKPYSFVATLIGHHSI
jgi:uncharacterized protein YpmS